MLDLSRGGKVHFVGVGGYGMSALARIMLEKGFRVSGSDMVRNEIVDRLAADGCEFFDAHHADHVIDSQLVVYSTAISPQNPELARARNYGSRVVHRSELLAALMQEKKHSIGVVGAHGKTTTASMLAVLFERAGLAPSFAVGGEIAALGTNGRHGKGDWFLAELDESDGSFERFCPERVIATNIDNEHVGSGGYATMSELVHAYERFLAKLAPGSHVFFGAQDPVLPTIAARLRSNRKRFTGFGVAQNDTVRAEDVRLEGEGSEFSVNLLPGMRVRLGVPGAHNVVNALPVIAVGLEAGIRPEEIIAFAKDFKGAKRRFEVIIRNEDHMVVEDYGHHPAEIRATLATAALQGRSRVVAVFQPHRYSRTRELFRDFVRCFEGVDVLVLTEIFSASEKPIEGVSGQALYQACKDAGYPDVRFEPDVRKVPETLASIIRPGDVVLLQGAGNIHSVAGDVCRRLGERHA